MDTYANKNQENKQQSQDEKSVEQRRNNPTFQFVDNRSEAKQQRSLIDMMNNSNQVKQLKKVQEMADRYTARLQHPIQRRENNTGLPDNLKAGVENLSGYSMDDVKVHYNSDKPAQLNAHAYAQGTDIHIASGQEKHLPHEAWHVVQQKQGRVKPTMQLRNKVNVNDDVGLEKEADMMGEKAVNFVRPIPTKLIQEDSSSSAIQRYGNFAEDRKQIELMRKVIGELKGLNISEKSSIPTAKEKIKTLSIAAYNLSDLIGDLKRETDNHINWEAIEYLQAAVGSLADEKIPKLVVEVVGWNSTFESLDKTLEKASREATGGHVKLSKMLGSVASIVKEKEFATAHTSMKETYDKNALLLISQILKDVSSLELKPKLLAIARVGELEKELSENSRKQLGEANIWTKIRTPFFHIQDSTHSEKLFNEKIQEFEQNGKLVKIMEALKYKAEAAEAITRKETPAKQGEYSNELTELADHIRLGLTPPKLIFPGKEGAQEGEVPSLSILAEAAIRVATYNKPHSLEGDVFKKGGGDKVETDGQKLINEIYTPLGKGIEKKIPKKIKTPQKRLEHFIPRIQTEKFYAQGAVKVLKRISRIIEYGEKAEEILKGTLESESLSQLTYNLTYAGHEARTLPDSASLQNKKLKEKGLKDTFTAEKDFLKLAKVVDGKPHYINALEEIRAFRGKIAHAKFEIPSEYVVQAAKKFVELLPVFKKLKEDLSI